MPLSVDGAVAAASIALLSAARAGASAPGMARLMLALGVLATLTANAYSGSAHGIAGMALAMWPGVAFIGSTETALAMSRRGSADGRRSRNAGQSTGHRDGNGVRVSFALAGVAESASVRTRAGRPPGQASQNRPDR
jgi:hypothetical protein